LRFAINEVLEWRNLDGDGISDPLRKELYKLVEENCKNCMRHRPDNWKQSQFTCPECGQVWVLAGVGPGDYWEKKEDQDNENLYPKLSEEQIK